MAEIVDFGLQQHRIKMDSRYFENVLSVVAGDTGRRIEVQLLDTNGMVQNTTGLNLRLNALIAGKATFTDATLVDAGTGKYQLDLSNGMFLAPGDWQFQWQITDSAGKKIHSFAFTGNVGSNISEGGSQATNFYLNLEDLKAMQDDIVNGTFNSEALEMNIAEKLEALEETYAPRLNEVTTQLAQTESRMNTFTELAEGSTTGDAELMDMRVLANGKVTTNAGEALRKTQTGEALQPKSITSDKLADVEYSPNLYNRDRVQVGKIRTITGGLGENTSYENSNYSVTAGEVYTVSKGRASMVVFSTETELHSYLSVESANAGQPFTFTIPDTVTKMDINVYIPYSADFMLVKGTVLPETYIPYYIKLKNFALEDGSIKKEWLDAELANFLENSGALTSWSGKILITFGDSITWYDGKPFGSTHLESGQIAVGYQSYLSNELGISINNQGVSGNHMGQILARIRATDITNAHAASITSGANDWTQQRPIGTLQPPKSTFDEETFYGAVQAAVESILQRNPFMKIVLITPIRGYHPTNTHSGEWLTLGRTIDGMMEQPDVYAKAFKEIAEMYGLELIDFRDGTGMNFYNYVEYMGDTGEKKVHPKNSFYSILGKYAVSRFTNIPIQQN